MNHLRIFAWSICSYSTTNDPLGEARKILSRILAGFFRGSSQDYLKDPRRILSRILAEFYQGSSQDSIKDPRRILSRILAGFYQGSSQKDPRAVLSRILPRSFWGCSHHFLWKISTKMLINFVVFLFFSNNYTFPKSFSWSFLTSFQRESFWRSSMDPHMESHHLARSGLVLYYIQKPSDNSSSFRGNNNRPFMIFKGGGTLRQYHVQPERL